MRNPKQKGSENERKIAKKLSLWFSEGANPNIFWRSQSSGGRSTQLSKTDTPFNLSFGDIGLSSGEGEALLRVVTIEAKHGYPGLSIMGILDKKGKSLFLSFWHKLLLDCHEAVKAGWGKEPLLIVQRNRCLPVIAMQTWLFNQIAEYYGYTQHMRLTIRTEQEEIKVMRLDDFLDWCKPEFFKCEWERIKREPFYVS